MSNNAWERPLSGIKVLDLTRLLPGPFCTLLLADLGADVLKIEDPGGDYARYFPPFVDGKSVFFASLNRNKRAMTLNLKDDRGVELLKRLVADADVLLESFRPGVMERLGVGYEALRAENPGLIYCSISGYGQTGELRTRAGHDLNFMAVSGMLEQTGQAGQAPVIPGFQLADIAGGAMYAAVGIVGQLYRIERERARLTDEQARLQVPGCHLDISMAEGALSFHLPVQAALGAGGVSERGAEMLTGGVASYGIYETLDGKYLAVAALEPKFWAGFVQAICAPELAGSGLLDGVEGSQARARVAEILKTRTRDAWCEVFSGLDLCIEPVLSPIEAFESQLFQTRQMFFELNGVRHTRLPLTADAMNHSAPPEPGEHTDDVLQGLGLGAVEVSELRAGKVV